MRFVTMCLILPILLVLVRRLCSRYTQYIFSMNRDPFHLSLPVIADIILSSDEGAYRRIMVNNVIKRATGHSITGEWAYCGIHIRYRNTPIIIMP